MEGRYSSSKEGCQALAVAALSIWKQVRSARSGRNRETTYASLCYGRKEQKYGKDTKKGLKTIAPALLANVIEELKENNNMNETMIPSKIDAYLKEVSGYPLLSPEEETDLSQRIQKGDDDALQQFVDSNRRYVVSVALPYQGKGTSLEDLIKAGNEGLETAARKFQPGHDFKFIAYAVWYIKQSIENVINSQE